MSEEKKVTTKKQICHPNDIPLTEHYVLMYKSSSSNLVMWYAFTDENEWKEDIKRLIIIGNYGGDLANIGFFKCSGRMSADVQIKIVGSGP